MSIFSKWCITQQQQDGRKRFWRLTEKSGGRSATKIKLVSTVRSHYDSLQRIAEDAEELGYKRAAATLRERLPKTAKARSGELGEIIASELVEESLGYTVPVRRLRYKDGREMALRGDDFIGINQTDTGLSLLKGESKSRNLLSKKAITDGRAVLNRDDGRCTPISLLFVADRLLERDGADAKLGRLLRNEVTAKALPRRQIEHVLFTLSGNAPPDALTKDFEECDKRHRQTVIHFRIEDHQDFIKDMYEAAGKLGKP